MSNPLPLRITNLRAEIAALGAAIQQLRRARLDSATAELLICRKREGLEDLTKAKNRDPIS